MHALHALPAVHAMLALPNLLRHCFDTVFRKDLNVRYLKMFYSLDNFALGSGPREVEPLM